MRLQTQLIIALIGSMQFTVCTGGLFVVPNAIAAGPLYTGESEIAMSIPSCLPEMPSHDDPAIAAGTRSGGCTDHDACLSQLQHTTIDRAMVAFSAKIFAPPLPFLSKTGPSPHFSLPHRALARDGPLYELAAPLSHMLVKRE